MTKRLLLIGLICLSGCGSNSDSGPKMTDAEIKAKEAEIIAEGEAKIMEIKRQALIDMSKKILEKELVSPASAVWDLVAGPFMDNKATIVHGDVDSQNQFGAMLRTHVIVVFDYNFAEETEPKILYKTVGDETTYFDRDRLDALRNAK